MSTASVNSRSGKRARTATSTRASKAAWMIGVSAVASEEPVRVSTVTAPSGTLGA